MYYSPGQVDRVLSALLITTFLFVSGVLTASADTTASVDTKVPQGPEIERGVLDEHEPAVDGCLVTSTTTTPAPSGITDKLARLRQQRPVLSESFTQAGSGWSTASDLNSARTYEDGRYHIAVRTADDLAWSTAGLELTDFLAEVETTQEMGPENANFGLIFRHQDASNFYLFAINSAGAFQLYKMVEGTWEALQDWTESESLEIGQDRTNHLGVLAEGRCITLIGNGQVLAQIEDETFGVGDVGLVVGTYDTPRVEVSFDELVIRDLARTDTMAASAPAASTPMVSAQDVLDAYRFSGRVESTTVFPDGTQSEEHIIVESAYKVNNLYGYNEMVRVRIESPGPPARVLQENTIYRVDDRTVFDNNGTVQILVRDASQPVDVADQFFFRSFVEDLLASPDLLIQEGVDMVSGVPSTHYSASTTEALDPMRMELGLESGDVRTLQGEIWLAQDGGYLIKADLRVEVDNVPQTTTSGVPVSVSQTIHWTMTLDAINQAFSIAAPVAGTPGPAQPTAPIQPSAPIQQAVPQATVDAVAPCQVQIRGRFLYVFDGTSDMCIRTIQGADASSTFRYGYWGNFLLAVNQAGQVYVQAANGQWQLAGQIVNADGTTGSLWDRCLRGSIAACNQLRGNFDSAIQDWTQLYPEDWFNAAKPEP